MAYKFIQELKKGDSGDDVKSLQNFIIEIHYDDVLIDGQPKKVEVDGDFGDITASAICSIKAKGLDLISTNYIKDKYKYFTGKYCPEDWLEINSVVNPLFGLFLERYNEVQEYLKIEMDKMDLTPDKEEKFIEEISDSDKIIEEIIRLELLEVGVREDPIGSNSGPRVNIYIEVGSDGDYTHGGIQWCNALQNWGLKTSADNLNLPFKGSYSVYTPSTVEFYNKKKLAIKNPTKSQIKKGMYGFVRSMERGGGIQISSVHHIYLIIGTQGNNVITVEGNTGNGGSVNGDGCYKRLRPINSTHCWCVCDVGGLYK